MNAICLVIDGLHHGYLGCYGNSWIGTAAFDRLAAESLLCDQAYLDTTDLTRLYRSLWCGWHAAQVRAEQPTSLMQVLADRGVHTSLVTDDPEVAAHPLASHFAQRMSIAESLAAHAGEETHLARIFSAAIEHGASQQDPFLLWIHTRALTTAWDAPLALRNQFVDEGEPLPPSSADVPDQRVEADSDPDELLGLRRAYAGQVVHLDECLGGFREWLDESGLTENTLLLLVGARGFPLGEHGRVGLCDHALYNELIHMPWLVRYPDGRAAAERTQALVQPGSAYQLLSSWWSGAGETATAAPPAMDWVAPGAAGGRFACCAGARSERAVRTPAWFLRRAQPPDQPTGATPAPEPPFELYAKPDDRWEVNEVAALCPDEAGELAQFLTEFERAALAGDLASLSPPAAHLLDS